MTLPLWVTNLSMAGLPGSEVGGGGQRAGHGGGGGDLGRDQVRTPALALPSLEVAVGGGRGALAGAESVRVHAQAHGTTREPPFGAGVGENLVETLGLGGLTHLVRAGDDQHAYALVDPASLDDLGRGAQILEASVGARTHEHHVDRDLAERRA